MKTFNFLSLFQDSIHAYNKLCEPILSEFDIHQVSFDILMFLANNPEFSTAQEISEIRNIKKNLVSVHVDKLVNAGLLQRGTIAGDRRKVALSYTENAKPIIEAGLNMQKVYYEQLTKGISNDKLDIYREIIETMAENAKKIAKS